MYCQYMVVGCELEPYYGGILCRSLSHKIDQPLKGKLKLNQYIRCNVI